MESSNLCSVQHEFGPETTISGSPRIDTWTQVEGGFPIWWTKKQGSKNMTPNQISWQYLILLKLIWWYGKNEQLLSLPWCVFFMDMNPMAQSVKTHPKQIQVIQDLFGFWKIYDPNILHLSCLDWWYTNVDQKLPWGPKIESLELCMVSTWNPTDPFSKIGLWTLCWSVWLFFPAL